MNLPYHKFTVILNTVSEYTQIPVKAILGPQRKRKYVEVRHLTMYLIRHLTKASCPQIGTKLYRDHSTVLHGIAKIEDKLKSDPAFVLVVEELSQRCVVALEEAAVPR